MDEEEDLEVGAEAYEAEPETNEDGSVTVTIEETAEAEAAEQFFDDNLAENIPEPELDLIAAELLDLIDLDAKAWEDEHKLYAEGLKRSGLSGADKPTPAFDGASEATHPMLLEASIDFAARAIKELFPPSGPAKINADGIKTRADALRADNKKKVLNWQLTDVITEYFADLQRGLSQTPIGGSQYLKIYHDKTKRRITTEYVPSDHMLVPYTAADFYSASRKTQIIDDLTMFDLDRRMDAGTYRKVDLMTPTATAKSPADEQIDKIQGREASDDSRVVGTKVFEVQCYLDLKIDTFAGGEMTPYVVTIHEYSRKILAIRRNWDELNDSKEPLDHFIELPFIRWRGSKSIGLYHIIGGLSSAAGGALRALLDSAFVNNVPSAFKLKGTAKLSGQTVDAGGMRIVEIEGPATTTDIRNVMMPNPFNPPSAVLYQLLEWLTNHARQTIGTAAERIADQRSDMPVGTVLALIEEGSHATSAIHMGLHMAQKRAFKIICRLLYLHLDEESVVRRFGEQIVSRVDFKDEGTLIPVSDPHIFSTAQRTAQTQAVLQLASGAPKLYDAYWLHRRALEQMKVPDIDQILPPPKAPKQLNPVAENVAISMARPVAAFPDQDHIAHITVHVMFMMDPMLGGNALAMPRTLGPMMEHLKQHVTMLYAQIFNAVVKAATGGLEPSDVMRDHEISESMDATLAAASQTAHRILQQQLEPFQQIFQQLGQMMQQMMQQQGQQMDPQSRVAMQLGTMENQRLQQQDQVNAKLREQELQLKALAEQMNNQLKQMAEQRQAQEAHAKLVLEAKKVATEFDLAQGNAELDAQVRMAELHMAQQKLEDERKIGEIEVSLAAQRAEFDQMLAARAQELDAQDAQLRTQIEQNYKEMQNLVAYLKNEADNVTKERIAEMRAAIDANMQALSTRLSSAETKTAEDQPRDDGLPNLVASLMHSFDQMVQSQEELRQFVTERTTRKQVKMTKDADGNYIGEVTLGE